MWGKSAFGRVGYSFHSRIEALETCPKQDEPGKLSPAEDTGKETAAYDT